MTAREALPEKWEKKLPANVPGYTIARLAVSIPAASKGFGAVLLIDAMRRARQVANQAGGPFLFVDAKDEAAARFYIHFGFAPLPDDPLTLVIPMSAIDLG